MCVRARASNEALTDVLRGHVFMHVCVCACVCVCSVCVYNTHTYIHTYIQACIHAYMHTFTDDVESWTPKAVAQWLVKCNPAFEKYKAAFVDEQVR